MDYSSIFRWGAAGVLAGVLAGCGQEPEVLRTELSVDTARHRVEVYTGGSLFTVYRFGPELEKPVLFPVRAGDGTPVTRGFPLDPGPGERVDHLHHTGVWLNFGDVNGFDFWGNSSGISEERKTRMGRIVHREILGSESGEGTGVLDVRCDWMAPDTDSASPILLEHTTFRFSGKGPVRIIDRTTRLVAADGAVEFRDNKEGMFAIRTARAFEHPSEKPLILAGPSGEPMDSAILDNEGVTGWYRNSAGEEGPGVWGKRARWVRLGASVGGSPFSIVMMDHPSNINHPSCWHARPYGLFSVNNLGMQVFDKELERFSLSLPRGDSLVFRHRMIVASTDLTDPQIESLWEDFTE